MQLRILILAATLALAVGKPYGNKGGYARDSDPMLVQSHVPAHEADAEHVHAGQGIKTAQTPNPHSGRNPSGEHASAPENPTSYGRYTSRTQDVSASRPFHGGHSEDDTQRPIGGGYGESYQRPSGGGYGENYQRPNGGRYGESYQRPSGGGYGENYQRPSGGGYGENYQRPNGGGYGENYQRPIGGGYGENHQRPIGGGYGERYQRPNGGGYGEQYQRPIGGGYGESARRPDNAGYAVNIHRPTGEFQGESFQRPIRGGYVGNSQSSPISGAQRQAQRSHEFGRNSNHEVEEISGGSIMINRPQTGGVKGDFHRQAEHVGY